MKLLLSGASKYQNFMASDWTPVLTFRVFLFVLSLEITVHTLVLSHLGGILAYRLYSTVSTYYNSHESSMVY
jgi:hypothetical protein